MFYLYTTSLQQLWAAYNKNNKRLQKHTYGKSQTVCPFWFPPSCFFFKATLDWNHCGSVSIPTRHENTYLWSYIAKPPGSSSFKNGNCEETRHLSLHISLSPSCSQQSKHKSCFPIIVYYPQTNHGLFTDAICISR